VAKLLELDECHIKVSQRTFTKRVLRSIGALSLSPLLVVDIDYVGVPVSMRLKIST
jgi:hypothetical protein